MNLHDYLETSGTKQVDLAKQVGVLGILIHQWATGKRPVPAKHCPAIERATTGAVRCEELRPDVDWAYLRKTCRVKKAA
jgi:DNA-binding transcriptional regulator YdaS (Cro superfamily)